MKTQKIIGTLLTVAALGLLTSLHAADVTRFIVAKGQEFLQTNATSVVLSPTNTHLPYRFVAEADASATDSVLAASVRVPAATTNTTITRDEFGNYTFDTGFLTKALLDAKYPVGNYIWVFTNLNDGAVKATNALGTEIAPGTPKVAAWDELQEVESSQPLTLSWSGFTNGTATDFVRVEITDASDTPLFDSPALLEPDALTGTNTSFQIPAGPLSLDPSTLYYGTIMFVKRTALNTTGYPGASGVAGYFRTTKFPLTTLPAPNTPNGRIQFSTRKYSASEADGQASILVTRSGDNSGPVAVDFSATDGTAHDPADYSGGTVTLNFADGVSTQLVNVHLNDNFILDSNRTVNLSLSNPQGGAELGNRTSAVLTILDNEIASAGKLQFSTRSNSVPEAGKLITLTVTRTGGTTGAVSVNFFTADDTAIAGQNYIATNGTLVFSNGIASKNIVVPIINDSLFESNEVFTVNFDTTSLRGGAAFGTNLTTKVGIVNDDFGGMLAFKLSSATTNENAGLFNVTVARTGGTASGVTVDYYTQDGTAQDGVRYYATNGTLTFGSNELSKTFQVGIINDTVPNGNQFFYAVLTNATGGARITNNVALNTTALTVLDDESSVAFSNAVVTVGETNSTLTATVVRTGALLTQVSVDFHTADGSAVAGLDYRATNGTLVFAPNIKSKTFTVGIINNTVVDGTRSFSLELSNPLNGTQLGAQTTETVNILDNDLGGTINFSTNNFIVGEGATNAVVTITRTGGLASGVTVNFALNDGSATADLDYSNVSQTVTFNAGETNKKVLVPIINDTIVENNETVLLSLDSATGGAVLGTRANATLTITNNDLGGVFTFARTNYSGFESSTNIYISITRTGGKASGVSVDVFTQNGTAEDGVRYQGFNGTLTFDANETNKILAIPLINDTIPNGNQWFSAFLTNVTGGATIGNPSKTTLNVLDDESSFAFSSDTYSVNENSNALTVTVQRTGALTLPATVNYFTTEITAVDHVNFISTNNGVLAFPTNTPSKTFTVPILRDPRVTGPLTFGLTLFGPTGGAQLGAQNVAVATINDKDAAGTVSFAASSFNVTNTSTNAIITIIRTGGLAGGVSVDFSTTPDTAQNAVDYTDTFSTVIFNAGETNKKVSVPIFKKTAIDSDKIARLWLGNAQGGATIGTSAAALNILEKRTSLSIELGSYSVNKSDRSVAVNIVRGGAVSNSVSVVFGTANGTAVTPNDYRATNGTATFAPGVTSKTIIIGISNNATAASNKSFNLKLSGIVGAVYGAVTNATISIFDKTNVSFSAVSYQANKTNANAVVTIVRSGDLGSEASVVLYTMDGTATIQANDPYYDPDSPYDSVGYGDYQGVKNTVNFPAGSSSQTVLIPLLNNPLGGIRSVDGGSNRWFTCSLVNQVGNGLELGTITNARVDIIDTLKHGTIQFSPTNYTASASGGSANLTITRTGGSDGIVTAFLNPHQSGTAVNGVDFDGILLNTDFNRIVFNPGETSKVITMTLHSASGTYPKTTRLNLNTPELLFGATFGPGTNATLNITP